MFSSQELRGHGVASQQQKSEGGRRGRYREEKGRREGEKDGSEERRVYQA